MHLTNKLHLALLILWTGAVPVLHAQQDSTPLQPGTRIRVRMSNHLRPLIGTYFRRTDSTLVVDTDSGRATVVLGSVTGLWASNGKRYSHAALGLAVGAIAGLGAGAAIAAATTSNPRFSGFGGPDFTPASEGAIGGFVLGSLLGVIVGGNIRSEHWISVSVPAPRGN
jgi:hypothetical protein